MILSYYSVLKIAFEMQVNLKFDRSAKIIFIFTEIIILHEERLFILQSCSRSV